MNEQQRRDELKKTIAIVNALQLLDAGYVEVNAILFASERDQRRTWSVDGIRVSQSVFEASLAKAVKAQ